MASSTRKEKIINSISPISLAAIVVFNLLLIYLSFIQIENENVLLQQIKNNTEISISNQKIGLNVSAQNHELIGEVLKIQKQANDTFAEVLKIASNNSSSDLP
jgi:hypothetical protein